MSDPLPQAFILTAIVITFCVSAFLLALIYRSWRLAREDEDTVHDDEEDIELTSTQALATVEVTDEDLADTPEFDEEPADAAELSARGVSPAGVGISSRSVGDSVDGTERRP